VYSCTADGLVFMAFFVLRYQMRLPSFVKWTMIIMYSPPCKILMHLPPDIYAGLEALEHSYLDHMQPLLARCAVLVESTATVLPLSVSSNGLRCRDALTSSAQLS